ncbi:MAG: hypothetical protein ACPGN3_05065 [Opitutales bacterium]
MNNHLILGLAATAATMLYAGEGKRLSDEDREAMKAKAQEHMTSVLDEGDENNDDYFSEDELTDVLNQLREHREEMREKMREKAEAAGRELKDRSEKGDKERPEPEEVAAKIIEKLDDDGDGLISRDQAEFALGKMAKRGKGRGPRGAGGPGSSGDGPDRFRAEGKGPGKGPGGGIKGGGAGGRGR